MSESRRQNSVQALKHNAAQGFHSGGRAPFGYRLTKKDDKPTYEFGPSNEVDTVKHIFQMAANGMGGKKIARTLNEQPESLKIWKPSTVLSILSNQAYLGHRTWNKKSKVNGHKNPSDQWIITENSHPAIIDFPLWTAAQESLSSRKSNS